MDSHSLYNQLYWHSRSRGMLELDLLLSTYIRDNYATMSPAAITLYQRLVAHEDPQLFDWLIRGLAAEQSLQPLINRIIEHYRNTS